MPRGRSAEVVLPDDVARRLLENNFLKIASISSMAVYDKPDFRKRQSWHGLFLNRAMLSELLQATGGKIPQQVSLCRHIDSWRVHCATVTGNFSDVERMAYRIRVMVSHLISAQRSSRMPPIRYDCVKALLQVIPADAVAVESEAQPVEECALVVAAVPCLDVSSDSEELEDTPCQLVSSTPSKGPDLDDLELALFTPSKVSKPAVVVKPLESKFDLAVSLVISTDDENMSDAFIDGLIAGTESRGPDTRAYASMFKRPAACLKRPAACLKDAESDVAGPEPEAKPAVGVKSARQLKYSSIYHREVRVAKKDGLTHAAAKALAAERARKAVVGM